MFVQKQNVPFSFYGIIVLGPPGPIQESKNNTLFLINVLRCFIGKSMAKEVSLSIPYVRRRLFELADNIIQAPPNIEVSHHAQIEIAGLIKQRCELVKRAKNK